jgi:3-methyladenine DNA glycosylase/8-oxoguanine DNA glycosylase
MRGLPDKQRMRRIAEAWRPYRSLACFYLWRSLDSAKKAAPKAGRKPALRRKTR